MKTKRVEALVASPPERDDLVVQLFVQDGGQWGEIIYEGDRFRLELYPQNSGDPWILDLEEVVEVFNFAKTELNKRLSNG